MEKMIDTREVILKLKQVRDEKNLSFDKILALMEQNNQYLSKSTLSRVFAEGSEDKSFRYEETLRPIANALLDIETIEIDDDPDTQAYNSILKLKKDLIEDYANQVKELKAELKAVKDKERIRYDRKMEEHTQQFEKSIDFVKNQILLKDQRIDLLLESNNKLLESNNKLLEQLVSCPCRQNGTIMEG